MNVPDIEKLPVLELIVRVLNINVGYNKKIFEKCKTLYGYAVFIEKIREYQKAGMTLDDAITVAIDFCVANGILVKYLKNRGSEVRNMLLTEWNLEEAKEVWREEALEEGRDERNVEIARNMLLDGEPVEKIMRYTGLTAEEVEDLKRQILQ